MESLESLKQRVNYVQIEFAIARQKSKEALAIVDHYNKQVDDLFKNLKALEKAIKQHPDSTNEVKEA